MSARWLSIALILAACSEPDVPLTRTRLPGLSVALPAWPAVERGESWLADALQLKAASDRMVRIEWVPRATDGGSPGLVAQLVNMLDAPPEAVTHAWLGGHEGHRIALGGKLQGAVVQWVCPEHERQYVVTVLGPEALADAIFASVRCHTEPLPAELSADQAFPRYEPPPAMKPQPSKDRSERAWSDGTSVLKLHLGTANRELVDRLEHNAAPVVRSALLAGGSGYGSVSFEDVPDVDGVVRHVAFMTTKASEGDVATHAALWSCPGSSRIYAASHSARAGRVDHATALGHLLRARCP